MDTGSTLWSHSRFAPVQIALWGHPVTTGMDSIDFFLVNDGMEDGEGWERFTEQVIRFDWLTFTFLRPEYVGDALASNSFDLSSYGVDKNCKIIMIPQSMQKFHVKFDDMLEKMLDLGEDVYVVAVYESKKKIWKDKLYERFVKKMGMKKAERFIFIPTLRPEEFFRLTSLADVVVDPWPFGGGVTSLEVFEQCKILVTVPSEQTVPMLTKGMYEAMGVEEFVVEGWEDGVDVVERVLRDEDFRRRGEERICNGKERIYGREAGEEFENWAKQVVGKKSV